MNGTYEAKLYTDIIWTIMVQSGHRELDRKKFRKNTVTAAGDVGGNALAAGIILGRNHPEWAYRLMSKTVPQEITLFYEQELARIVGANPLGVGA